MDQERLASGLPCEDCGSSDARSEFITEDGKHMSHCYSCTVTKPIGEEAEVVPIKGSPLLDDVEFQALPKRGLSEKVCRRYGYGFSPSRGAQVAPYMNASGRVVAQKLRLPGKTFTITGDISSAGLFGQQLCRTGGKRIAVTEGEIDCLSIAEAIGDWPVVSLPNGAGSARKALQKSLEFLMGYDVIVLAFDSDKPGRDAAEGVLDLFKPGQVHLMQYEGCKDANDMLVQRGPGAVRKAFWDAKPYRPDSIINLKDIREKVFERPSMGYTYPWSDLTEKTCGFHKGDLVTWTSGTGVGKSSMVSEVAYHCGMNLGMKVGIISLEEGVKLTARRLIGVGMNKPVHHPMCEYTDEEFAASYDKVIGSGRFAAYDHFGSDDIERIEFAVRYLFQGEDCDVVFLDHISMVVSGADLDTDERRQLDNIMTKLRTLAVEVDKTIHVVSHLRRGDGKAHEEGAQVSLNQLRGSQIIAQVSNTVIAAERNQQAATEQERNQTMLRVLKNRLTGQNGPACKLQYDPKTGRLSQTDWNGETDASTFD